MISSRAALAFLVLAACTPEKPLETPQPEQAEAPAPDVAASAKYIPAPAGEITVKGLVSGARVTSPLTVEGTAINDWFFEGQFVAELVVDGEAIVLAPAMQAGATSWTDPGPVDFKSELSFDVAKETSAELILSEDMPQPISDDSDVRGPARSIRIPVVLVPPK